MKLWRIWITDKSYLHIMLKVSYPLQPYSIQKVKKLWNVYIYTQTARKFPKSKTICVTFLFTRSKTLHVTQFSWKFWNWHLYIHKKHDTLRYVRFLYTKCQTLCKNQDNLCSVFLYTKILTLCVTRFSWNSWNWRRGGSFLWIRNNALCVKFLYAKNSALSVTFLY